MPTTGGTGMGSRGPNYYMGGAANIKNNGGGGSVFDDKSKNAYTGKLKKYRLSFIDTHHPAATL